MKQFKQFHCPQEPGVSRPLTTHTFGDIAQLLTLLQHAPLESIERSLWIDVKALSQTAIEELCALIWIGPDHDGRDAWQALVMEARRIVPCYVHEKISHPQYLTNGLARLALEEQFTMFRREAPSLGIAA